MTNPKSTYRIQFNKDFTFQDFEFAKDYFKSLGVSTVYASPIFEAVTASTHGYDVCNPLIVNPEIGDQEQLYKLSEWLKQNDIQWLQDIVPNHMAFHPKNKWLKDVLEKGVKSEFSAYFDTSYTCLSMSGKLMVPFLGESLKDAIKERKLTIKWNGTQLVITYGEDEYPLKPNSYDFFLNQLNLPLLIKKLKDLKNVGSPKIYSKNWELILKEIANVINDISLKAEVAKILSALNAKENKLLELINDQNYELCQWSETNKRINYRRFFTVNGLICLNMADEKVFEKHHQFIKKMINEKVFDGLRIDHIDGLFEPTKYLKKLRDLAGKETYIIAEKILKETEEMPITWPIQGNTGYDFLAMVNNLFIQKEAQKKFQQFYKGINNDPLKDEELVKKRYILENHFAGELDNLCTYFFKLGLSDQNIDKENFKKALGAFLIYIPVYRFYSENYPINKTEQTQLRKIFDQIRKDIQSFKEIEALEAIFITTLIDFNEAKRKTIISFFKRCMQFSGPLMAKGVEDTLMYTHFSFIGNNEVGDHPNSFGITVNEFHELMKQRQKQSPLSLNTTSTHDTKRGEDARARLNVLTSLPQNWLRKVKYWQQINRLKREQLNIKPHEEYFIYQCLIAHYPINNKNVNDFESRLNAYLQKAFREGKEKSDWANVNTQFEENVVIYVAYLLNIDGVFFQDFIDYHHEISQYGIYNSLAQVGLKFTSPGIPDVYQGTELLDFSFVDPDNRREVDYQQRLSYLKELKEVSLNDLLKDYPSGKIKLFLTHQLFKLRKEENDIFTYGDYIPVEIEGKYKEHIIAFIRKVQNKSLLIIAVINAAKILENQNLAFADLEWKDTKLQLPKHVAWFNILQKKEGAGQELLLNEISLKIPFAVLKLTDKKSRNSGVLMHISSLPSNFGLGDLGPEAYNFVNFLNKSNQRYWQLLPIGPGASTQNLSPYSTLCSMAANPLFISPEFLAREGYLKPEDLTLYILKPEDKIEFEKTHHAKAYLLKKAFENYRGNTNKDEAFENFISLEKDWIIDFALFLVLREKYNQPWYKWPKELKRRDKYALKDLKKQYETEIIEQQWYQYQFQKQWTDLKNYCIQNEVHLIGDLPFYVNHDSSDVWANQHLFSLDADGNIDKMAGVPPDYFSADGQLWGMPVYNWTALEKEGYEWWLNRLQKNNTWFKLLRLDHFRAFYNYWSVDASENTAVNGNWCKGPGSVFLNIVKAKFPLMPYIAEDLGDIDVGFFKLRDEFDLPGIKVLQFAFGDDLSNSPHIPHHYQKNFIAYTGTHDNNTTKGWYRQDLNGADKNNINLYFGKTINEDNIANELIRAAFASVSKTVIIPIQDILNLDENHRMNSPGTITENWAFRILPNSLNDAIVETLKNLTNLFGRK